MRLFPSIVAQEGETSNTSQHLQLSYVHNPSRGLQDEVYLNQYS